MNCPSPRLLLLTGCLCLFPGALRAATATTETAAPAPPAPTQTSAPASRATGTYSEKLDLISDGSVADSLARQNNLNFSSVRIDGEKSNVSLSALTAEQILNAVATKVPTPDLDADAIGGLLQLTSRRAFDQTKPTLRGSLAVGHDSLSGHFDPDASITFGRSLGAKRRVGFLATLEHRQGHGRNEEIELEWRPGTHQLSEFQLGDSRDKETETNFNGTLDWKLGEKSFAFFRAEAGTATETDRGRSLTYRLPGVPATIPDAGASIADGTIQHSVDVQRERSTALTLATGASYHGEIWRMDLRLTHLEERQRVLDERDYEFEEENVALVLRHGSPAFPSVTAPGGAMPGNPARQTLDELEIHRGEDRESDSIASFDVTRFRNDRAKPGWLKAGVKARQQHTQRAHRHDIYEPAGAGLRVSDAAPATNGDRILSGRYSLAGFPDLAALDRLFATEPQRFALDADNTRSDTDAANFDVRQQIAAGYAMGSFSAGANRFVVGGRLERTASRFTGNEISFDEQGRYESTRAVSARNSYSNFFPGFHASRPLGKNVTIYGSWTQSIRRPDYTDLVPSRQISRSNLEIEEGNSALRPTLYTNYDAAIDYAYRDDGQVSLELFHREIRDPSLTRRTLLVDGPFAGYERSRPENGGRAEEQGSQLTWQQELKPLSPWLDGLELEVNYTHLRSRQTLENRLGESLPLTNRPAHEVTVQLSYERGPYYLSVEFEHTSHALDSIGRRATEDRFEAARNNWDISLNREFGENLRVFFEIENLAQAPERGYEGNASRPNNYAREVRQFSLGVKWER